MMSTRQVNFREIPEGELKDLLRSEFHPLVQLDHVEADGCFMSTAYKDIAQRILDFEVKDDDVYVCSFPKSGSTWTQEMVWCIGNDLDFNSARNVPQISRFPLIEFSGIFGNKTLVTGNDEALVNSVEYTKKLDGRRFIKSHLPVHLLPIQLQSEQCKAKIVYVARDVRDVFISYYHHYRTMHGYTGSYENYFKLFLNNRVIHAPYWMNILSFWNIRNQPNVLFITYEDMKKDLPAVIRRVSKFLDKPLTPEQVASLTEYLSFNNMKKNPSVNLEAPIKLLKELLGGEGGQFIREGKSGGFVKEMTPAQIEDIMEWSKKQVEGTDYKL